MNLVKDQRFFANKLELICTINSTMNRWSQLNCTTSAGRPNFPIYKALEEGGRETSQQLYWMAIQFGRPNNLEKAPMGVQGCGMVMVKDGYFSEDIMVSLLSSN